MFELYEVPVFYYNLKGTVISNVDLSMDTTCSSLFTIMRFHCSINELFGLFCYQRVLYFYLLNTNFICFRWHPKTTKFSTPWGECIKRDAHSKYKKRKIISTNVSFTANTWKSITTKINDTAVFGFSIFWPWAPDECHSSSK